MSECVRRASRLKHDRGLWDLVSSGRPTSMSPNSWGGLRSHAHLLTSEIGRAGSLKEAKVIRDQVKGGLTVQVFGS